MNGMIVRTFLLLTAGVFLVSCGLGDSDISGPWEEEVTLRTGEVIIVHRELKWSGGGIGESHGPLTYASLGFVYHGKKYAWHGRGLHPMILQVEAQGIPVVISVIPYCWAWEERGRPSSAYVADKFIGEEFRQVSLESLDIPLDSNLSGDKKSRDKKLSDNIRAGEAYRRVVVGERNFCT